MIPFLILLCFYSIFSPPVYAQTTPAPTSPNDKIEDVKGILKQIVKETSGDTNTDTETTVSKQPKSFFGTITQIDSDQIKINIQDQTKTLYLTKDTTFVNAKRQQSKITDFKSGQTVLAMGYLNPDQSLDCRRLVFTESKSVENINQTIIGQIVDVSQSQNSPIFVLIPSKNKNSQYQIKTDSKTEITDFKNNKLVSAKTIITSKKVIVILQPDTKLANTFYAAKIIDLQPETDSNPWNSLFMLK